MRIGRINPDSVHCDSCGIFVIGKIRKLNRYRTYEHLGGERSGELEAFDNGQGFPMTSYSEGAGLSMARLTLEADGSSCSGAAHAASAVADRSDEPPLPACTEKHMQFNMFDKKKDQFPAGAHMPLLVFFSDRPGRGTTSLAQREHASVEKGWGPSSWKRADQIQKQGFGPKPYIPGKGGNPPAEEGDTQPQWHNQVGSSKGRYINRPGRGGKGNRGDKGKGGKSKPDGPAVAGDDGCPPPDRR